MELRHLTTARLRLDAVVPGELDEHYALLSDPGVWAHLPSGRHTERAQTMAAIEHSVGHWRRDGLGYWTARLLVDLAGTPLQAGSVVGTGGCALRVGTSCERTPSSPRLASSPRGPGGGRTGTGPRWTPPARSRRTGR